MEPFKFHRSFNLRKSLCDSVHTILRLLSITTSLYKRCVVIKIRGNTSGRSFSKIEKVRKSPLRHIIFTTYTYPIYIKPRFPTGSDAKSVIATKSIFSNGYLISKNSEKNDIIAGPISNASLT